jgi:tetratricopeptide (TPR) repeat protein
MVESLLAQLQRESFTLVTSDLPQIMEEIRLAYDARQWDTVIAWCDLLNYKLQLGRYWVEATQLYDWAITAAEHAGQTQLVANYLHDFADILAQRGYYHRAEPLYQRSFDLYEQQLGQSLSATKTLHMLALAKRALGKNEDAIVLAQTCLDRAERLGMGSWRAHPLHLLAWLARDRANFAQALQYLTEALQIHTTQQEHAGTIMLAQVHYDIARTLIMAGRLAEVEPHIEEVLLWSGMGNMERFGYMATKLYGDLARSQGFFSKALKYYHLALDRAQTGPDERRVAEIHLALAHTYWRLGARQKALGYWYSGVAQLLRLGLITRQSIWVAVLQWFKRYWRIG